MKPLTNKAKSMIENAIWFSPKDSYGSAVVDKYVFSNAIYYAWSGLVGLVDFGDFSP